MCGASLPTTIVSYSVSVNVLKIECFFLVRKPTTRGYPNLGGYPNLCTGGTAIEKMCFLA